MESARSSRPHAHRIGRTYGHGSREATPRSGLSKDEIARDNERFLAEVPEAPPVELGGLIREAVDRFLDAVSRRKAHEQVVWAGDAAISLADLAGVELGELLLHGYDIASVVGAPWPIEPGHAALVLSGYGPLYRTIVNQELARGLTADVRVELRGGGAMTLRFADGASRSNRPAPVLSNAPFPRSRSHS